MDTAFLDWALADFSGYVAADELYDGPFCILSAVDNRRYKRILYDVLDHDPPHEDIRAFLGRLKTALVARCLTLCGFTTDGSALYPAPLKASIMAPATLSTLAYPVARCGGLRGAGGISTDARIAANIDRGFCPKNRSAAVVPSERNGMDPPTVHVTLDRSRW